MQKPLARYLIFGLIAASPSAALAQDQRHETYAALAPTKIAGKQLFELKTCSKCHTLAAKNEGKRTPVRKMREPDWFSAHVKEHSDIVLRKETNRRKRRRVFREELTALKAFLFETSEQERKTIDTMPRRLFEGAYLVYQNRCLRCHTIAGAGKDIGPDLSDVGKKHDKAWFIANLKDPKQFAPDTQMPSFSDLPQENLEKIAEYLLSLKK